MGALPKIGLVAIAAVVVVGPHVAHAEVNPDASFLGADVYPTGRTSFGSSGSRNTGAYIYGASQSYDCNKAGLANPGLFAPRTFKLEVGSGINWDYINSVTGRNQYMLFPTTRFGLSEWPSGGTTFGSAGADKDPIKWAYTGHMSVAEMGDGIDKAVKAWKSDEWTARPDFPNYDLQGYLREAALEDHLWDLQGRRELENAYGSLNVQTPADTIPDALNKYVSHETTIGGTTHTTMMVELQHLGDVLVALKAAGITNYEYDWCRQVLLPSDPNYARTGRNGGNSWGEKEDDQWAIKRAGFTDDESSAWNKLPAAGAPVVVAVIDTGLDWHHLDIDSDSIWRNTAEDPDNGIDDDRNGYVDDVIGWDFLARSNKPWDFDGHGTVVTGIIAAAHNDVGIAGINPNAKIMVLKAVNNFGTTRASFLAEAIVYAVDNGAQVINISVGGPPASRFEQAALNYAAQAGVLVIAASGNDGVELVDFGPGGNDHVLTVGATHVDDRAAGFSNYGDKVDLVAPGVDVLSLRARYTDANYRPGPDGDGEYKVGDNYVGNDKRYLHVSGTSFSTPIVAGVASLIFSKNPEMTAEQVEQILLQTATDVEMPGKDQHTGHGMVDARAALSADADFSVTAEITRVELVPADAPQFARVYGTIDASQFKRAWMQIGPGENPGGWRYVGPKRKFPIRDSELGIISIRQFSGSELWQVVVNVEHKNGVVKSAAFPITVK